MKIIIIRKKMGREEQEIHFQTMTPFYLTYHLSVRPHVSSASVSFFSGIPS